jgi:hypothetical protein
MIYLIVLPVALAGSLFLINQVRRYRLRRSKAKAIRLHREMRALKKTLQQVINEA